MGWFLGLVAAWLLLGWPGTVGYLFGSLIVTLRRPAGPLVVIVGDDEDGGGGYDPTDDYPPEHFETQRQHAHLQ